MIFAKFGTIKFVQLGIGIWRGRFARWLGWKRPRGFYAILCGAVDAMDARLMRKLIIHTRESVRPIYFGYEFANSGRWSFHSYTFEVVECSHFKEQEFTGCYTGPPRS